VHAVIDDYMIPFAAYTAAETPNACQLAEQPQNCTFLWGISSPSNIWFLGPTKSSAKRHLDLFSHFCTEHPCDQHRDRQTDKQTTLHATSL